MGKPNYYMKSGLTTFMWEYIVVPSVLKRDNNKCTKCGSKDNLDVHHKIKGIQKYDNLITLCRSCHKKEHMEEKKHESCTIFKS